HSTATTTSYPLSLHDALPISTHLVPSALSRESSLELLPVDQNHRNPGQKNCWAIEQIRFRRYQPTRQRGLLRKHWRLLSAFEPRSEEHTSELQSTRSSRMPSS